MKRTHPPRPRDRARLLAAFVLALAVHVGAAWLALRLEPSRSPPPAMARVTVELREAPLPAAVVPKSAPPPERPRRVVRREASSAKPPPNALPPAPQAVARAEVVAPPAAGHVEPGGQVDVPADAEAPRDPGSVRLFDLGALGLGVSRWKSDVEGLGDGEDSGGHRVGDTLSGDPEAPEVERARIAGRLSRDLAQADASHRVSGALVDPYFTELSRGLKDRLRLNPNDMAGRGRAPGARSENFLAEWLPYIPENFGSPLQDKDVPDVYGDARPSGRDDGARAFNEFCLRWNDGQFAKIAGWVVLQLVQTREGRPLATTLLGSSGHPDVERIARETVLEVASKKVAPEQGLGLGGPRIKSIWRFEAKILSKSPQCGVSGRFGEELAKVQIDNPLAEEVVVTHIALLAVYGGTTAPATRPQ